VVVPCAADLKTLTSDCRGLRKLQLKHLEAGCTLVGQLPRVLGSWTQLTELR
jgi:hypothetical protein